MLSAHGPEYVIQAYYKYKPASIGALALLVSADGKDRFTQMYQAEMLRLLLTCRCPENPPPSLYDLMHPKAEKMRVDAQSFVDTLISSFRKEEAK